MKWYYSEKLKMYVSLEPLQISTKVFAAAKQNNITLKWDDNGYVTHLSLKEAKCMADSLDGYIMTPAEYWTLHQEATDKNDQELLKSLESSYFTEILDRIYVGESAYIDHPIINDDYSVEGELIEKPIETGRPGWVYRNEINLETGHPDIVHTKSKDPELIKYWSPYLPASLHHKCFPIRGYVTSVGTISLDLGIPIDSQQPKQMLRLCRIMPPDEHDDSDNEIKYQASILEKGTKAFENGAINNCDKKLTFEDLKSYMLSARQMLKDALELDKMIVLTMGHRNPDSDTVISSVMEGFRYHLKNDTDDHVYLPVIQSKIMPREIRRILGDDISDACIYEDMVPWAELIETGHLRVIFTDQNYQEEYQKYLIAVTDHHDMSAKIEPSAIRIPFCIRHVGSTASLITAKFIGEGYSMDSALLKIMYSAMLMDTENRVEHKMTPWDQMVMDVVKKEAEIADDNSLYEALMNELLWEQDLYTLFSRDYKKFVGFGFAVLKVTQKSNPYSCRDKISKLKELASYENHKYHYLFTLLKIVQYEEGGKIVEKEQLIPVFREDASEYAKKTVMELLKQIVKNNLSCEIIMKKDELEICNAYKQLSRKVIAPQMEKTVEILEKYTYIPVIDKYVCRDFLKITDVSESNSCDFMIDSMSRVCNITFREAKALCESEGFQMLSLKEYWQVLNYAMENNDYDLYESMTDKGFLEYLDTVCADGMLMHHPEIKESEIIGTRQEVTIQPAYPGLILPNEIDSDTGLPGIVHSPAEYGNKELWRYWSPETEGVNVFSRSYIFLLDQMCLDAKMTTDESCVNLGIRPVLDSYSDYIGKIEENS